MKGSQIHHAGLKISKLSSTYPVDLFLHFFLFPAGLSNLTSTCPEEYFVKFPPESSTFLNIGQKIFSRDIKTQLYVSTGKFRDYFFSKSEHALS